MPGGKRASISSSRPSSSSTAKPWTSAQARTVSAAWVSAGALGASGLRSATAPASAYAAPFIASSSVGRA